MKPNKIEQNDRGWMKRLVLFHDYYVRSELRRRGLPNTLEWTTSQERRGDDRSNQNVTSQTNLYIHHVAESLNCYYHSRVDSTPRKKCTPATHQDYLSTNVSHHLRQYHRSLPSSSSLASLLWQRRLTFSYHRSLPSSSSLASLLSQRRLTFSSFSFFSH